MNNNKILHDIFYDPKTGLSGYDNFKYLVKKQAPDISSKEIKAFYDKQEISQISKKPILRKDQMLHITDKPLTFQIDIMYVPIEYARLNSGVDRLLFCVEVTSRKAYLYTLRSSNAQDIMNAYKRFLDDLKADVETTEDVYDQSLPSKIISDSGFNFNEFINYNHQLGIELDSSTSKDDHFAGGNRLGIIDRATRSIKDLLNKYIYSHGTVKYIDVIPSLLENYNNRKHRSLEKMSPNEVFQNRNIQNSIIDQNVKWNNTIQKDVFKLFSPKDDDENKGMMVRISDDRNLFEKEKPRFSKQAYNITDIQGNRYFVEGMNRPYKRHELQPYNNETEYYNRPDDDPIPNEPPIPVLKKMVKIEKKIKQAGMDLNNIVEGKRIRKPKINNF